jgi:hypothetical protein
MQFLNWSYKSIEMLSIETRTEHLFCYTLYLSQKVAAARNYHFVRLLKS